MNPSPEVPRRSWALLFLAAGFAVILATSLWQRFSNPSLTINRFAQAEPAPEGRPAMADMENMTAIGQLMEHVAKNPHDVAGLLRLCESLMAVGQWGSAENFALKALSEPGENSRAMYLLAVINHNQGKHAEAAELLEKLLAKEENPSARYSLAILNIHYLNNPQAGRKQLEQGLLIPEASSSLRQAMQEELAKLPPEQPEEQAEAASQQAGESGAEAIREAPETEDGQSVEKENGKTEEK